MSIERIGFDTIMHEVVVHNGTVYLGGITAEDASAGMREQAQSIFRQADALLRKAGSDKSRLLSAALFITDMRMKPEMNEAWMEWLEKPHMPGRATIGVSDLGEGLVIEASFIAATA